MKHKFLTLFLSLVLTVSTLLTGCSSDAEKTLTADAASESGEETEEIEEKAEDEEKAEEEAEKEAKKEAEEATEKKEEAEKEEAEEETIEASRGTITDGMFVNETFGIAFAVTDDMTVFSDEQMLEALGVGSDIMADDGVANAKQIEEALQGTMYDAMIMFSDNSSNVSVSYENMDITSKGIYFDEEQYGQMLINMLGQMSSIQYDVVDENTIELGGKEYYCLKLSADYNGIILEQTYLCRRQDNYMIDIIISSQEGSQIEEEFLDSFVEPASLSESEE